MKAKKPIEVAMPIKEISAESMRDKSIRSGHISTLHYWPARRPLPVCRAIVFASLIPDPLDQNAPNAFVEAVNKLLKASCYKPYNDIPYTTINDPLEDNLRNRLLMFIGKFSEQGQTDLLAGKSTPSNELISCDSLIKCESKDNPRILKLARELIFVAFNAEKNPSASYSELHALFDEKYSAIKSAEKDLFLIQNRHIRTESVISAENRLRTAIEKFQSLMPSIMDPFAGGGAIPLEAARLGCRSFGNDLNPVAHVIERCTCEYPQKFGKPIVMTPDQFTVLYGSFGKALASDRFYDSISGLYTIPNRLAWDVEYYGKKIIQRAKELTTHLYPALNGEIPAVYYWVRFCTCDNCKRSIPLLKNYTLSSPRSNKDNDRIKSFFVKTENNKLIIEIRSGLNKGKPIVNRGNVECPFCHGITDIKSLKRQFSNKDIDEKVVALIFDKDKKKRFLGLTNELSKYMDLEGIELSEESIPNEVLFPCSAGGDVLIWGYKTWGEIYNKRQLKVLDTIVKCINEEFNNPITDYQKTIKSYMAILLDRIAIRMTSMGKWHYLQDTVENLFGNETLQMKYDYPELNPFSSISSSALGQLESIIKVIKSECDLPFSCVFYNTASGEKTQFKEKTITATITDPPYYNAIAYADNSDFFYTWHKKVLFDVNPILVSTPQTPKEEECTALKHHHGGNEESAKSHFESKLTQILNVISCQTQDIVSIMFAHQSTEAWTTLCNSILSSKMNITGSWPIDTEVKAALKSDKSYLESSVTVSCRPSQRQGFAEYKEVKKAIEKNVKEEVNKLYELGFRGADLLTACFGQAVSEFGKYEVVEKSNGDRVRVAELLELAREAAFNALIEGVQGDNFTKFYLGWLQLNGMSSSDYDDVTKFTRVGLSINIKEVFDQGLLIKESKGKKQHIATASEHLAGNHIAGTRASDLLIDQAHRAILFYKDENRPALLKLLRDINAQDANASFWRLLASLKELLPACDDLKQVQGLLQNGEDLRQSSRQNEQPTSTQTTIEF